MKVSGGKDHHHHTHPQLEFTTTSSFLSELLLPVQSTSAPFNTNSLGLTRKSILGTTWTMSAQWIGGRAKEEGGRHQIPRNSINFLQCPVLCCPVHPPAAISRLNKHPVRPAFKHFLLLSSSFLIDRNMTIHFIFIPSLFPFPPLTFLHLSYHPHPHSLYSRRCSYQFPCPQVLIRTQSDKFINRSEKKKLPKANNSYRAPQSDAERDDDDSGLQHNVIIT